MTYNYHPFCLETGIGIWGSIHFIIIHSIHFHSLLYHDNITIITTTTDLSCQVIDVRE